MTLPVSAPPPNSPHSRVILTASIAGSYINTAYWTYSELVLSFICACVPTFRPVLKHFSRNVQNFAQRNSSKNSSRNITEQPITEFDGRGLPKQVTKPKGSYTGGFARIGDSSSYEATAYSQMGENDDVETGLPLQGIKVQKGVHLKDWGHRQGQWPLN